MNKKWIKWLEKHTIWRWNGKRFIYWHKSVDKLGFVGKDVAQPADLLGWQIAFAEECGYIINIEGISKGNYAWDLFGMNTYIITKKIYKWYPTYQEAFDAAWDKFLKLSEQKEA